MKGASEPAFGIYIHWPFCESKCPYCDFNSHVAETIDQARWLEAYLAELAHYREKTGDRTVTSIFFGGGTPSLMAPETAAALIAYIKEGWPAADDLEITLEANPSSAETAAFDRLRGAGVNRLSIGVQSLDDDALIFLGRRHDAAAARRAVARAREIFPRYSFDLIYGRPGQTEESWHRELSDALDLAGGHVSLYQLTIEPGTAFHAVRQPTADDDTMTALYERTQALTVAAGLPAYEISNHARPGEECRHNLVYWRGEDYLGIGPGAHGRLTAGGGTRAIHNFRDPARWLELALGQGCGLQKAAALNPDERRTELVLMGLRLAEGISTERYRRLAGADLASDLPAGRMAALVAEGLLERTDTGIRVTPGGRQRLDGLLKYLLGEGG